MNQPVPVSRKGAGLTRCRPPVGHVTVTSAATSETTSATPGLARSRISWTDGPASARHGTARTSAPANQRRIEKILYRAKRKKKGSRGRPLEPGCSYRKTTALLHQAHRLDGLRLRGVHVSGLASRLGLADQLHRIATRRGLGTGERARRLDVLTATRGLNVLTRTRSLDVLAGTRGLDVLTSARSLDVLAGTRGLDVLTSARSLDVLAATRSLNVLTSTRGLHVLTAARSLDVLTCPRRLNVLARAG